MEDGFSFLYKGIKLDCGYRLEIVVEDKIILSKNLPSASFAVNYYSKSSN
jgi:hypothetical protein